MNCIVTAGPTSETLDRVRRLTNFSTGRLGIELAGFLADHGHDVTMLVGAQASHCGPRRAQRIETFVTSAELREWLQSLANPSVEAVFHVAAVSDFMFGKIWLRSAQGKISEIKSGKISSRQGTLLAELVPTPKIIAGLRDWFPKARIVGWKFEVDGKRGDVVRAAEKQISECLTDACVGNGPAYGDGFALVWSNGQLSHLPDAAALYEALERFARG
jgi:phosphopantothenoylcysteine synthetase/decarboxylase